MATIAADSGDFGFMTTLGTVRRIEAASFRAFPSQTMFFDGTWALRLTSGLPVKRLNSVNPLDPADISNLPGRIDAALERFTANGVPLVFRNSPLAPKELEAHLDRENWSRFDESIVMVSDLTQLDLEAAIDQISLKDVGRWVDACLKLNDDPPQSREAFIRTIETTEPQMALFLNEDNSEQPVSAIRCVRDNDLAGIFELATVASARRCGHGRAIFASGLKWARAQGARSAWLQVVASNEAAISLYRDFGFHEIYRYCYRGMPL
ncbi:MAG: GNAT family N-acetyltransferase [Nitratireductor sp.]